MNAPDEDDLEDRSEEESEDSGNGDDSKDNSDESEESDNEGSMDRHSDKVLEEDEKTKDDGVHHEVVVQGGIAHGNVGHLVVSFCCICILFCIPYIVM